MAEAVKVALIRDGAFFEWLEEKAEALALFTSEPLDRLIRHCAVLHMRQIAHGGDPFERGSVRPLDFGHWAAHKLEALSHYELRHGEAVAIGIALDTRYSVLAGLLPRGRGRPRARAARAARLRSSGTRPARRAGAEAACCCSRASRNSASISAAS